MSPYTVTTKAGYWNIIHSMSVDYQGTNVVQLTPYTNFYCSYKAMTSWSADDVVKYGAVSNFFPDTSRSCRYISAVASATIANGADGLGMCNNRIVAIAAQSYAGSALNTLPLVNTTQRPFNEGMARRCFNTGNLRSGSQNVAAITPLLIASDANMGNLGLPFWSNDGGAAAARKYYVSMIATIRLKDLHSFFEQLPLVKGAYLKLIINYNASTTTQSYENAAPPTLLNAFTQSQQYGSTCVHQVASSLANQPLAVGGGAVFQNATLTVTSSVKTADGITPVNINCRLYVPLYTMSPQWEQQYIQLSPAKEVIYRDIYSYVVSNVSGSFNQLLTNGIVNPKALVVIPMISGAAGQHADIAWSVYQSPYATEPATPSYGSALYSYNVQVSGVNLYQSNEEYDYDQFLSELSKANAINGGVSTGLCSGLIGRDDFQTLYRYYVSDLSRGFKADSFVPKSILIQGNVYSTKNLDLFCFIEYERKLTIDIISGAVINV